MAITEKDRDVIRHLLEGTSRERLRAVDEVATLENRDAVAAYLAGRFPGEEDPWKRTWSISALAAIGRDEDVALIGECLADAAQESWTRYWAAHGLARMNVPDLKERLEAVAEDNDPLIKGKALRLLVEQGANGDARTRLHALLESKGWWSRWCGCKVLRRDAGYADLPDEVQEEAFPTLAAILSSRQEAGDVSMQAAWALGAMRSRPVEAVRALESALRSDLGDWIRRACIEALVELGRAEGKEALLAALDEDDAEIRFRAANGLREVLGESKAADEVVERLLRFEARVDRDSRYLEALRLISADEAAANLTRQLQNPDQAVANRAATALANLGGEAALRTLQNQRKEVLDTYSGLLSEADNLAMARFDRLMGSAQRAFSVSMAMHATVFVFGLVLMIAGLIVALQEGADRFERFVGIGAAGSSLATILWLFYRQPIQNIRRSVTGLVKVNVVFQGFVRQINQVDATFKRRFLDPASFGADEMTKTVDRIQQTVAETLNEIERHLPEQETDHGTAPGANATAAPVSPESSP
jgi:HEAT repeat protein